jgi:hypothetical protein
LDELPETLDETYERALQSIDKEKREFAHRIFQCLTVAIRPLRVDEFVEVLAILQGMETIAGFIEIGDSRMQRKRCCRPVPLWSPLSMPAVPK